jgi:hypothetical protein
LQHGGGAVISTSLLAAALLLSESAYEDIRAGSRYQTGGRDYRGPHPLDGLHAVHGGWLLTVAPDGSHPQALRYLEADAVHDTIEVAIARLREFGVQAVPCLTPDEAIADAHFAENELWLRVEQPELGLLTLPAPVLGPPNPRPAPHIGEHNDVAAIWGQAAVMSEAGG